MNYHSQQFTARGVKNTRLKISFHFDFEGKLIIETSHLG